MARRRGSSGSVMGALLLLLLTAMDLSMMVEEGVDASYTQYQPVTSLANVDASFHGEKAGSTAGIETCGAGDVNGDGLDDLLIVTRKVVNPQSMETEAHLFFGKYSGWGNNTNVSTSDASFYGKFGGSDPSFSVCGAGDLNGDGYDDFAIGSATDGDWTKGTGKVHIFFGKPTGWKKDQDVEVSPASFQGENANDNLGYSVAGPGDVNGDGLDDLMVGANNNSDNGREAGKTYLIFGKKSGWTANASIANADASFLGENAGDSSSEGIAGAGDVNADGYDDMLIGAPMGGGTSIGGGAVYLVLGRRGGWSTDVTLDKANASFIENNPSAQLGLTFRLSGLGDLNSDGYDDIGFGTQGPLANPQLFIFFGKGSGWSMKVPTTNADVTINDTFVITYVGDLDLDDVDDILSGDLDGAYVFLGKGAVWPRYIDAKTADHRFTEEETDGEAGLPVAGCGDVNGDGCIDLLVSDMLNDWNGKDAGKVYLVHLFLDSGPKVILSLETYEDKDCTISTRNVDLGSELFIELTGIDRNATNRDITLVKVRGNISDKTGFLLPLLETDKGSGVFRGSITPSNRTDKLLGLIRTEAGEQLNISSVTNNSFYIHILIRVPIQLLPLLDITSVLEDEEYNITYWNAGYNEVHRWELQTNASWLNWDEVVHRLNGIPDNGDVGEYFVDMRIMDALGHIDEHYFDITVSNVPPNITTDPPLTALEDEPLLVDMDSSDDGQGDILWQITDHPAWLGFDVLTGLIEGAPGNDDVGEYPLMVTVTDGNGGSDSVEFTLTVVDVNDPPVISAEPSGSILQNNHYEVWYSAVDMDDGIISDWTMDTNASWLSFDDDLLAVFGTPLVEDIGVFYVNVTAEDPRGAWSSMNHTVEVLDRNDAPVWSHVPLDQVLAEGSRFVFHVEAVDPDPGDLLTYNISTNLLSDLSIDRSTGEIDWYVNIEGSDYPSGKYLLQTQLTVWDGEAETSHWFTIEVVPDPRPTSILISPENGSLVPSTGTLLEWEGWDNAPDMTYTVYIYPDSPYIFDLTGKRVTVRSNLTDTSYLFEGGDQGRTYFWTVTPWDRFRNGDCTSGFLSFRVNRLPTITLNDPFTVHEGEQLRIDPVLTDNETSEHDLVLSLISGPGGMDLDLNTNDLVWTPGQGTVGVYQVLISVSDGLESTNASFTITVLLPEPTPPPPDDKGFPLWAILLIAAIVLLVIAGIAAFVLLRRKRGIGAEAGTEVAPTEGTPAPVAPVPEAQASPPPVTAPPEESHVPPLDTSQYEIPPAPPESLGPNDAGTLIGPNA